MNSFLSHAGDIAFLALPRLWYWMHPFKALHVHQHQSVLDNLVKQIIKQRQGEDDDDDKRDLLTLLSRAQDLESKYKLTNEEVHDEILAFLFAGFESTTSQLCWVLYHLGEYEGQDRYRRDDIKSKSSVLLPQAPPTQPVHNFSFYNTN